MEPVHAIRKRGEVEFAEAGEGVILRFTNADLAKIEENLGEDYFNDVVDKAQAGRVPTATVIFLVKLGAKKDGKPYAVPSDTLDDMAIADLADLLIDALAVAKRGKTFRALVKEFQQRVAEKGEGAVEEENPSPALTTTSPTISGDEASGQG